MIVIVDNYDSFTYNLVQRLGELDAGLEIEVVRNDQTTPAEILAKSPSHLIISPGPCTPNEAGISVRCVSELAGQLPILGVCLGHQSIGHAGGGKIVAAHRLMHGKVDQIHHDGNGCFQGIASPFNATRYHSLVIQPDTVPEAYDVTAWAESPDGVREVMGVRHKTLPIEGWQFHPESFLTTVGPQLLANFLELKSDACV